MTLTDLLVEAFDAVDLFAGPGGWSEGLRRLGLRDLGIELDAAACATRYAAGHWSWQADVASIDPRLFRGMRGLIASPPCPKFSATGDGEGIAHLPALCEAVHAGDWSARPSDDPMIWLALEVGRWAEAIEPEWIALEQVPEALPLWRAFEAWLQARGYSTWSGELCAADYGVPQTRRRAILMASRSVRVSPPKPTHHDSTTPDLFGELLPWVSMSSALGWLPSTSVDTNRDQRPDGTRQQVSARRPAPTLTAKSGGQWHVVEGDHHRMLTVPELLVIQSFEADHPVEGGRTSACAQVGNAVPPRLAAPIVEVLAA